MEIRLVFRGAVLGAADNAAMSRQVPGVTDSGNDRAGFRRKDPARPLFSITIGLDIQQRKGAEHARQIRCGRRMQVRLVEFGKAGDAEQPETADNLIFQQFQHPHDAGLARGSERPALQATDTDQIGPGGDRLHDVGAAAERTVDHDLGAAGNGVDDFRQNMH